MPIRVFFLSIIVCYLSGCITAKQQIDIMSQKKIAAETNVELAILLMGQQSLKEAQLKLILAQQLDPNNPAVWYGLAFFNESAGEAGLAEKYYKQAIMLAPENAAAHNNYGAFLCRNGHYQDSIAEFMQAIHASDYLDVASAYENAGLCAMKIPDQKLAINFFQKALRREPNLTTSRRYLTNLLGAK